MVALFHLCTQNNGCGSSERTPIVKTHLTISWKDDDRIFIMDRLLTMFAILFLTIATSHGRPFGNQCDFSMDSATESVESVSNLAIKLYQQIKKPDQNTIFSPVSIALALALMESGSIGRTKDEIQALIGSQDQSDSSNLYQSLLHQLQIKGENSRLSIVNGLFYSENLRLKTDYVNKMKYCFGTQLAQEPFSTNTQVARHQINQWVSNATQDKIPELLKEGSVDEGTLAVLVNAIYMKAPWMQKFSGYEDLPFYQSGMSDQAKMVHFMTREGDYGYSSSDTFSTVEIPYIESLSMHIILPNDQNGLPQVEKSLKGDQLIPLFRNTENQRVSLKLPKFTIRQSVDLKQVLVNLGLKQMFSDNANFNRMTTDRVKISSAVHEAYIKVNRNGTEAGAASSFVHVSIREVSSQSIPFVADHPFIFAIVHKPTEAIVFMGKVNSID